MSAITPAPLDLVAEMGKALELLAQSTTYALERAESHLRSLRQDVTSLELDRATDRLALRDAERRIRELEEKLEGLESTIEGWQD